MRKPSGTYAFATVASHGVPARKDIKITVLRPPGRGTPSRAMMAIVLRSMRAASRFAREMLVRYRQRQLARNARHALHQLDDRTLHDIGLDRTEIPSVAAELAGEAERSRVRVFSNTRC